MSTTMYDYRPEKNGKSLYALLPSCSHVDLNHDIHTLNVDFFQENVLSLQEIGRIVVLNGKCRSQGIRLALHCSQPVFDQLVQNHLDRIIWVDHYSVSG